MRQLQSNNDQWTYLTSTHPMAPRLQAIPISDTQRSKVSFIYWKRYDNGILSKRPGMCYTLNHAKHVWRDATFDLLQR